MLLTPSQSLHSLTLSTPFLHGTTTSHLTKPTPTSLPSLSKPPSFLPPVRAIKSMQGRVVCATNDKTVSVEVCRLAPHPKYKKTITKRKKFQAHDPDNQFKVGDLVLLLKSRPISKTKSFVAMPAPVRNRKPKAESEEEVVASGELGIALESQQDQA